MDRCGEARELRFSFCAHMRIVPVSRGQLRASPTIRTEPLHRNVLRGQSGHFDLAQAGRVELSLRAFGGLVAQASAESLVALFAHSEHLIGIALPPVEL